MLTVLMIDDDADLAETVGNYLTGANPEIKFVSETDFKQAPQRIREVRPDVVILDWFQGSPATGEEAGKDVWKAIWKAWFCPVVLYSAGDVDVAEEVTEDHPFVKTVAKGGESLGTVAEHLGTFQSHIGALREVAEDIDRVKHDILRDLSAVVFTTVTDSPERLNTLKRSARRRIAAVMDDHHHISAERALPWEQYIYPVLTKHPIMGDLIRLSAQPATNKDAYRVILGPCPKRGDAKRGL
jgi:DNA-binding NarL/FixJ family response regulator